MPDDLACFKCGMPVYDQHEYMELKKGLIVCKPCIGAGKLSPEEETEYMEIYK